MSSDKRNDALVSALLEERRRKAEEDRKRKGKGKLSEEVKVKEVPKAGRQTSLSIREPGSEAAPPVPTTVSTVKPSVPSAKPSSTKSTTKALLKNVETPPKKGVVSASRKMAEDLVKEATHVDLTVTPKKSTTSVGETGKDVSAGALFLYKPNRLVVCGLLSPAGYSRTRIKPYKAPQPRKRKEPDEESLPKKPKVPKAKKPKVVEEEPAGETGEDAGGLEIVLTDDVVEERAEGHEVTEVASEDEVEEGEVDGRKRKRRRMRKRQRMRERKRRPEPKLFTFPLH